MNNTNFWGVSGVLLHPFCQVGGELVSDHVVDGDINVMALLAQQLQHKRRNAKSHSRER